MYGKGIDFVAGERHFVDHLAPVWKALGPCAGRFWVPPALESHARRRGVPAPRPFLPARVERFRGALPARRRVARLVRAPGGYVVRRELRRVLRPVLFRRVHPTTLAPPAGVPVVVASLGDLRRVARDGRPVALAEHGIGQSYGTGHPSYCGGVSPERSRVGLFLVPNEYAARANRRAYPGARSVVVGCPKLDPWVGGVAPPPLRGRPVVAISFHWDCRVAPETRSAWPHFRSALPALAERFRLLGHGHPRALGRLRPEYERLGIEAVAEFEQVLRRAHVYVTDNSSTLFEFAATDRPVVVLNAPWYRRRVEHGLRFWSCADVGVQCDEPEALPAAVELALEDAEPQRARRARALQRALPLRDGHAAHRAALAILEWLAA